MVEAGFQELLSKGWLSSGNTGQAGGDRPFTVGKGQLSIGLPLKCGLWERFLFRDGCRGLLLN